jgi:cupin 2 domain-containing protein
VTNLLRDLPTGGAGEVVTPLLTRPGCRIERIVSHGEASPPGFWYDQDEGEWVAVLAGAARLEFEDGIVELGPGDAIDLPPHRRHRVAWTAPDRATVWLAVHYAA